MKFDSLALLPLIACVNVACGQGTVTWSVLDKALPKPISSDMTATAGPDGLIYIAGGCDARNGNVFNITTTYFDCLSSTDDFLSFNPETYACVLIELLPRPHYHHAAAVSNNVSYTARSSVWRITSATVDSVEIEAVALL
ncbi:hypothetical protein MHU86_8782 [Fragilaria crotonensis]|nr:hypothetical protein MHU86_8782 [Fragilaria crotonensis]